MCIRDRSREASLENDHGSLCSAVGRRMLMIMILVIIISICARVSVCVHKIPNKPGLNKHTSAIKIIRIFYKVISPHR